MSALSYPLSAIRYQQVKLFTVFLLVACYLLVSFAYLLLFPSSAFAQAPIAPSNDHTIPTSFPVDSPHHNTQMFYNTLHTFFCVALGQSPISPCLEYKMLKDAQGTIRSVPMLNNVSTSSGVLGSVGSVMSTLYSEPPIRSSEFIAGLGRDIGLVEEANAQVVGSGNAILSPIFTLWEVSRNFAYLAMIIVFLIIGLMVMFRQRLNPQTVVSVQLALPGLVIGLVMITFSYFIASLISDVAFIGTNVVGYYFSTAQKTSPQPLTDRLATQSVIDTFSPFLGIIDRSKAETIVRSVYERLDSATQNHVSFFTALLAAQFIAPVFGALPPPIGLFTGPISGIVAGGFTAANPPYVLSFVVAVIAVIALIYQMLKLLMRLISSYLTIIFLTITAPFQLLMAALPGRQGIATAWMLNLLGNVLVFPAVLAVFYFVAMVLGQDFATTASGVTGNQNAFIPSALAQEKITVVGQAAFPLLGGLDLSVIQILLAFGALMALPSIPDLVVRAVGKAGQAGQVVGNEITAGIRTGQSYYRQEQGAIAGNVSNARKSFLGDTSPHWNSATSQWVYTRGPSIFGHLRGERIAGFPGTTPPVAPR